MTEQEILVVEQHLAPFQEQRPGATASPEMLKWIEFCSGLVSEVRLLQGEVAALGGEDEEPPVVKGKAAPKGDAS